MIHKALTRYMLEEEDTTLLFQVELMSNNTASQGIDLPSSRVLKKERATMVKKHIKYPIY